MAYNLESLIKILDQIMHSDPQQRWNIIDHKKPQIQSLLKKASSLKLILENSSPPSSGRRLSLENRIRDAAHKAEDLIESHIVELMLLEPGAKIFAISPPDLQHVIQELDSTMEEVTKKITGDGNSLPPGTPSTAIGSSSKNHTLVGLDEDLYLLKDRLKGKQKNREIIPLIGMGGIGKTTLAQNLYHDPLIVSHFDTRAWITISQDYKTRDILLCLLRCIIGELSYEQLHQKNYELVEIIYKSLYGKRYLIVLDDMWSGSTKAFDEIKFSFPDNKSGSRIIITAREPDTCAHLSSSSHKMSLLNESDSWKLLHLKVFGEESCPSELEPIGRKIAKSCGGLPLALESIGGLLSVSKDKRTEEFWKHVSKDVSSILAENDENFTEILSLSYTHLPTHLKPCFLYMGAFPEKYEVRASNLVRLWIAEGFIKSIENKSLEDAAEEYLQALVDRNLISIQEKKHKITYSIHDVLRDLCVKRANEEKFIFVKNRKTRKHQEFANVRRLSANPSNCYRDIYTSIGEESASFARSFLCIGPASHEILTALLFALRLLRVLEISDVVFHRFPAEILRLVNLRYLSFTCYSDLPSAISKLGNLQTLIVRTDSSVADVPLELWELPELRYVVFKEAIIWIVSSSLKSSGRRKLQKISSVNLYGLIESGFLETASEIRNLGICVDFVPRSGVDLRRLQQLETLKLIWPMEKTENLVSAFFFFFPPSLKKMTLTGFFLPRNFMRAIGALPNLQVLKIRRSDFQVHCYCFGC